MVTTSATPTYGPASSLPPNDKKDPGNGITSPNASKGATFPVVDLASLDAPCKASSTGTFGPSSPRAAIGAPSRASDVVGTSDLPSIRCAGPTGSSLSVALSV